VIHEENEAMRIWSILEAVQWRWTINEILEQPNQLLTDVLQLAGLSRNKQLRSE
jgi:hypothetical protein